MTRVQSPRIASRKWNEHHESATASIKTISYYIEDLNIKFNLGHEQQDWAEVGTMAHIAKHLTELSDMINMTGEYAD